MKRIASLCLGMGMVQGLWAQPALTIYNQNFAVVRDTVHLELQAGTNTVNYNQATMHLEPDSVVLRDSTGKHPLQILEQNYRADPISRSRLLNYYEGKTIDFETEPEGSKGKRVRIRGKIIRGGSAIQNTPMSFNQSQELAAGDEPIVEVNGKLIFQLPGEPLFPALSDDGILKPTLNWQLQSETAAAVEAELSYITSGMKWEASYNLVSPENGNDIDLVGWVTIDNQSGKTFTQAKIKLMAGDVNKEQVYPMPSRMFFAKTKGMAPPVQEKAFDEYHLYTLDRLTTLVDRQTKQVEFVHAQGIRAKTIYIYDGAKIEIDRYRGWDFENIRNDPNYGTESNPKVRVMREFTNSAENHLGLPLPKGRLRFYRQDADGQMEFTGENSIDHTPRDEVIRVTTGDAFDLVGKRKMTEHQSQNGANELDETFEIELHNHKQVAVEVGVVEHLYRASNWKIISQTDPDNKKDAQTVEFPVRVEADGKKVVRYSVHYTW